VETIAAKKSNQNRYLGLIWAIVGHFGSFKAGKKIHIFHRIKNTISIRYFWIGKIIFHLFSYEKKKPRTAILSINSCNHFCWPEIWQSGRHHRIERPF
jgi:hypothetical protein